MPTKVIFRPNKKGVAALALSGQVRRPVRQVAEEGRRYAQSISPVHSGEYKGSFEIVDNTVTIAGMLRAGAMLINTASHAAAVEWGNAVTPRGRHVLGRTLSHLNSRARLTK